MSAMKTCQDLLRRCLVNARPMPLVYNCQIMHSSMGEEYEIVPEEPPVISATGAMGAMIGMLAKRRRLFLHLH